MTLMSEITRVSGNIAAAYTALDEKGATLPETQNSANLADTIATVSTGGSGVVRGGWTVPIEYLDIDAATNDETNEVFTTYKDDIYAVVGFTLSKGYYTIGVDFGSSYSQTCPKAVLLKDGTSYISSDFDSTNGTSSDITFDFDNLNGDNYIITFWGSNCGWSHTPSSSAKMYIVDAYNTRAFIGGYATYSAIKATKTISNSTFSIKPYQSGLLESFNLLSELPTGAKASSFPASDATSSSNVVRKYFPPITDWCQTAIISDYSSSTQFQTNNLYLPDGSDLSGYTGTSQAKFGPGNPSPVNITKRLYITLPNSDVQFNNASLSADNWNYIAEHAPTVSGKTLTLYNTGRNPKRSAISQAITTLESKGWTISGLASD